MQSSRRRFLTGSLAALGLGTLPASLCAQTTPADAARLSAEFITTPTQTAIDKGLVWLAARQNDDGGTLFAAALREPILVSAEIASALGGKFASGLESIGCRMLKGMAAPVEAFRPRTQPASTDERGSTRI